MGSFLSSLGGETNNNTTISTSGTSESFVSNQTTQPSNFHVFNGSFTPVDTSDSTFYKSTPQETSPLNLNNHGHDLNRNNNNNGQSNDYLTNNHTLGTSNDNTTLSNDDDFNFTLFGYDVKPFQWADWNTISPWIAYMSAVAMVLGCVLPYVPQYWTIHKTKNSRGFSTLVCLALLIANISRIAFWFGIFYDMALLVQSGVMIIVQLMLLELCVRVHRLDLTYGVNNSSSHHRSRDDDLYDDEHLTIGKGDRVKTTISEKKLFTSSLRNFWAWTDLLSYLEILSLYTIVIGISTYFFKGNNIFVQTIGYFSVLTEAMLAMPQLVKNFKKQSVVGLSVFMVLLWLLGDTFKLAYFIVKKEQFQFKLCGMIQITIDILILCQIYFYRNRRPTIKLATPCGMSKNMVAL